MTSSSVKGLPFALSRLSKVATRLGLIYIISSLIVAPWLSVLLLTLGLSENATLASWSPDGATFVRAVDGDEELTRSFELESFALAFAEGQRIRLGLTDFRRL